MLTPKRITFYLCLFVVTLVGVLSFHPLARAQTINSLEADYINLVWLIIAGALVFFMNAGFAMLEAGICQTRNAVNVLAKNLIVFCVSILAFWWLGFGLMFGDGNGILGQEGFFFQTFATPLNNYFPAGFEQIAQLNPGRSFLGIFFFQLVFAGTSATIVSGAVAERIKFWAFFWFSFCLVGIAYPIAGRWVWGPDGWLASNLNFLDFAGSTVVHSVGGTAGLLGTMLLGPRIGWQGYESNQKDKEQFSGATKEFAPYNLTFSTLGCLILWLGWLGFNGGSVKSIAHIPHVIVTTMIAAASGGVFILLLRGLRRDKPPLPLVINGILGGLVGITASSAYVTLGVAMFIGAVSGLCVILADALLEYYRIDDPVGVVPVHLGCGVWGTFAVGLFVNQLPPYIEQEVNRAEQILGQLVGILSVQALTIVLCLLFWLGIGMILYLVELFNEKLKRSQNNQVPPSRNKYQSESLIPESPLQRVIKYFNIAREALRVSAAEEKTGSDGTFQA
ncbi:ammonium transporter [Xenococcus sp. PCC 7305]|uniref:ammonium transporter n=1 Tax=Xenococcus sp. PCC 7305 TaxID=102125 RepID=UPI0002ACA3D6|nr:ammonium transporter [Xenococcus sp. PCC 7305]ELS01670.1 ammonium transporter [Xenococcus sp. PCC 7305]